MKKIEEKTRIKIAICGIVILVVLLIGYFIFNNQSFQEKIEGGKNIAKILKYLLGFMMLGGLIIQSYIIIQSSDIKF